MLRWDATTSDVEGCVDLNNPRDAASQFSLEDDDVPVLVVLDKMHDLKWSPFRCRIDHRDLTPSFDCRGARSKGLYFKCLLKLEDVLLTDPLVSSEQPQSYYKLVL